MATYPNIPTEKIYPTFREIGNDTCAYFFPWGKKIYGFCNGALTALIPLAIVYTHCHGGHYAQASLWAKVAGKGECYYPLGATFFASTEDYMDFINGDKRKRLVITEEKMTKTLFRYGYKLNYATLSSNYIMGWRVSSYDITPRWNYMDVEQMWLDADGLHINFVENGNQFIKYEDALEAQKKKINIVDFDEEETEAEVKEFSLDIKILVRGTTKTAVTDEIVKAMEKLGYNVNMA